MSLLDETYFIQDISLDDGDYSNLANSITRYEKEILEKLFSYSNAKLLLEYNAGSPQWVLDVVEGKEYIINGETYKWIGLINSDKISLIAYYIYYNHLLTIVNNTSAVGNVQAYQENGNIISFGQKIGAAWVKMGTQLYELNMFLSNEYPDIEFYNIIGNVNMFDL